MVDFRIHRDSLGVVEVPADRYWGPQTQRSLELFKIGPSASMPWEVIVALAQLKKAAAKANFDLGVLSEEKMALVVRVCDEILSGDLNDHFPLVIWQTGSGTHTNMNLNEVIAGRAQEIVKGKIDPPPWVLHPNDDVNRSQSSNDIYASAVYMAAYQQVVNTTLPGIKRLKEALEEKAHAFSEVFKVGRTHCMDAVPMTLGQEFSAFSSQVGRGLEALEWASDGLLALPVGGTAVGTGLNAPRGYDHRVVKHLTSATGLPFRVGVDKFELQAAHEALVSAHAALKQLAMSIHKISGDIQLLASGPRCGIGEIYLPEREPGSSIMPGKVNPTQCEAVSMVCLQVLGNDVVLSVANASGRFQINTYRPLVAANFLQSARLLGEACQSLADYGIQGVEPNHGRIASFLDQSLMQATALNTYLGYDRVAELVKIATDRGQGLKSVVLELEGMTEEAYDRLIDIKKLATGK